MNKVCVKGQRIYFYRHPEPIPKSQVNFSRIEFDMDETWSSFLSVVAQFIQGGNSKNVQVKDGYCFVPPELEVGDFELCLRGDDGESVVASVNRLTFEVCEGFDPSGETPLPPSPDLYTQLVKEIDSGKKIAQSVREDADAGLFNGERGADGGWYTPSVTQTDENTLRMNFTPSKGDMPDVEHMDITLPGGGSGTSDHSKLSNRDAADQHPMSSITGLVDALAGKQPTGNYLTQEQDPTVPEWAKQPQKPSYTADEVGAVSSETLPDAINTALAQAKESGEFDGAAGQDGAPGQDGITPTIGDNGNWYLGDTDTGKPSRGENGQAGPAGPTGPQGPAGPALAVNNTAAVGQTVKITAVDENGQPTEWEAVDMASGGGGITAKVEKVYTMEEAVSMFTIPVSDFDPAVYPAIQVALTIPTDCTAIEIGLTVGGQNCKATGIPVKSKNAYHFIFIGMDNLNRNIPSSIGIGPNNSTMTWKALYWYGYNSGYSDGLYFLVDEATPFPAGATIRVRSV